MSETTEERGAAVRFPPPFVPLIGLALGLALEWIAPLPIALGSVLRFGLGGLFTVAGLALMVLAMGRFRETGQDPKPWEPSPSLIATGIYRFTRNPMYVAMGFLQGGLGLLFASLWPLLLVPVTWWVIYQIAIRHEEAYLRERFGADYDAYCQQVRRWL